MMFFKLDEKLSAKINHLSSNNDSLYKNKFENRIVEKHNIKTLT
jgi:hypothetical protein